MSTIENNKQITFGDIIKVFNIAQEDALKLNYLVRDSELQAKQSIKLEILIKQLKAYKYQAMGNSDEKKANLLFHFQCILNSLNSILKMWLLVKEQEYHKAWVKLVDAQEYISVAIRAYDNNNAGINKYINVLSRIEKTVFPEWALYLSPAYIEDVGKCSICNKSFPECNHIEGLVYTGRLCRRIDTKPSEVKHVALVPHPRDKRCIISYISSDDGRKKDNITLKVFDEKFQSGNDNELHMTGVVLTLGLDFD